MTMMAASLEKLPCHVDCPHISSRLHCILSCHWLDNSWWIYEIKVELPLLLLIPSRKKHHFYKLWAKWRILIESGLNLDNIPSRPSLIYKNTRKSFFIRSWEGGENISSYHFLLASGFNCFIFFNDLFAVVKSLLRTEAIISTWRYFNYTVSRPWRFNIAQQEKFFLKNLNL